MENGREFRVNIWDFGGQEIYHATHQFFLTKRSLYALVADNRKEDTNFYRWLNVVELLSDSSPVLIVKNEKSDRTREINEPQLKGQFNNLKETLATNLAKNDQRLNNVIKEIKHQITSLPHLGTPLPKTWVKVRETLENDPRNYISLDEYLNICQQNGFTRHEDKLQLSGYLHDLGVCLHFQDDRILEKTLILKPKWGTDAVYRVLDDPQVINNLGKFTWEDLKKNLEGARI
ncbi:COR domain-containing protein [Nostoc piscinale]|uniref:COR domain-containing protein n=1 Tax=Nostoc piscinale TaxID=224012 RepID=UPI0007854F2A|nr:COR domain-containing protein [Nostoc piscinale]